MGIKDKFTRGFKDQVLSNISEERVAAEVESVGYHTADLKKERRFIPAVDYYYPRNFAVYGLAEEYYKESVERVYKTYPYDGSLKERLQWENDSSYLDLYILNKRYPRTHGYITFCAKGWGSLSASAGAEGYGAPDSLEYISFVGGPHSNPGGILPYNTQFTGSNYYDTGSNRQSNLRFDLESNGATIEFWLKKENFNTGSTSKEVIFDLWNGHHSSSDDYGRCTLMFTSSLDGTRPVRLSINSGSTAIVSASIATSSFTTASLADGLWHHYAVTLKSASAGVTTRFYVDGDLNNSTVINVSGTSGGINLITGTMQAYIGALITPPYVKPAQSSPLSTLVAGAGKMSASMDEFRYWKTQRSSKDIGRYWFDQVGGGSNTDPPITPESTEINSVNTLLGVYYKFNEGITGINDTDSVVLDYSGRVTNGAWVGYLSGSRATGSAMIISKASPREFKDPIIYSSHPRVQRLQATLQASGSNHDVRNNSNIYSSIPTWVLEEDEEGEGHIKRLTQILSSYLDTLQLQIQSINRLKDVSYPNPGEKPIPFANHLLESCGLISPEVFLDADVFERLADRSEDRLYDDTLNDIKNIIYKNVYNNLSYIYKSKGTLKAFRNLIRCYGIDEDLVRFNLYANNIKYKLRNNSTTRVIPKRMVNFNTSGSTEGTVFQYAPAGNANAASFISGASELTGGFAFTCEANVVFPPKKSESSNNYLNTAFVKSSLFGVHGATKNNTDTTWDNVDGTNFQVYAIKEDITSPNVRFSLENMNGGVAVGGILGDAAKELTTQYYQNVYDNTAWNFAVIVRPTNYPYDSWVSGSDTTTRVVEFHGINTIGSTIIDRFSLSQSVDITNLSMITGSRRVYAGSHRTNFTGNVLHYSDAKISDVRYWLTKLSPTALEYHARDFTNYGIDRPNEYAFPFLSGAAYGEIPLQDTLILNWDFNENTGSDGAGQITVADFSSGSAADAARAGFLGNILYLQHPASGTGFDPNTTNIIDKEYLSVLHQNNPENLYSDDMVSVLTQEREEVFSRDSRPINYFFAFEKSMYQTISEQMLNFFATMEDIHTMVGAPVNRYRIEYKALAKARNAFFARVQNPVIDFDKFYEYYKWFDSTLSVMLQQLVPASADVAHDVRTVVESHVLERNKYHRKFPTIEFVDPETEAAIQTLLNASPGWKYSHHPPDGLESKNQNWWLNFPNRSQPGLVLSASNPDVNISREAIFLISNRAPYVRRRTTPYRLSFAKSKNTMEYHGGINYNPIKRRDLVFSMTYPLGPGYTGSVAHPKNIMLGFEQDVQRFPHVLDDEELHPQRRVGFGLSAVINKSDSGSLDYEIANGEILAPFSLYSASVTTGYNAKVVEQFTTGVIVTNIHSDTYGPHPAVPMQSHITERWVGGREYRHVRVNQHNPDLSTPNMLDSADTRPEGFKIFMGKCSGKTASSGAIGIVDPQYPDPSSPSVRTNLHRPKGNMLRSEVAKRPVNIKNIRMTCSHGTVIGNFSHNYQYLNSVSRTANDFFFVKQVFDFALYPETLATRGRIPLTASNTANPGGVLNYALPERTGSDSTQCIFVERFSSPGGFQVQSRGYLAPPHEEYSVYNNLNYRNTLVRGLIGFSMLSGSTKDTLGYRVVDQLGRYRGLKTLLTNHCGPFGSDSVFGTVFPDGYVTKPSFHKVPRNPRSRMQFSGSSTGSFVTGTVYDNWWIQHSIPRSTRQYAWVTASLSSYGPDLFGYVMHSGVCGNFAGVLNLPSRSAAYADEPFIPMVHRVKDGVTASANQLGYPLGAPSGAYINPSYWQSPTFNNSADWFNTLMLNRNGPYQYPSWKQIRGRESRVIAKQKKTNIMSVVDKPSSFLYTWPKLGQSRMIYPKQPTSFTQYIEQPISSRYFPIQFIFDAVDNSSLTSMNSQVAKVAWANKLDHFSHDPLNTQLGIQPNVILNEPYKFFVDYSISSSVAGRKNAVLYKEQIYPREVNAYRSRTRTRTQYTIDNIWNKSRKKRSALAVTDGRPQRNSQGFIIVSQSVHALDAHDNFNGQVPQLGLSGSSGELQNNYNRYGLTGSNSITASALYAMRVLVGFEGDKPVYGGDALSSVAYSSSREPFLPYDEFGIYTRLVGPDYTIVPEFRISEHLENYLDGGGGDWLMDLDAASPGVFSLTGSEIPDSSLVNDAGEDFYQVYGYTDFLKYFKVVDNDINMRTTNAGQSIERNSLDIECTALLKFLPYKGFYPFERPTALAERFSASYGDFISSSYPAAYRAAIEPILAPGVCNNTIKSGIAVGSFIAVKQPGSFGGKSADISLNQGKDSTNTTLPEGTINFGSGSILWAAPRREVNEYNFDRVPWEAFLDPGKYLNPKSITGSYIWDNGVGTYAALSGNTDGKLLNKVLWNSTEGKLYRLAADNFACAVTDIWMTSSNGGPLSYVSKPQSQFGSVEKGAYYALTLNLDRTLRKDSSPDYNIQYNRASAFGPPFALDTGSLAVEIPGVQATGYIDLTASVVQAGGEASGNIRIIDSYDELVGNGAMVRLTTSAGNGYSFKYWNKHYNQAGNPTSYVITGGSSQAAAFNLYVTITESAAYAEGFKPNWTSGKNVVDLTQSATGSTFGGRLTASHMAAGSQIGLSGGYDAIYSFYTASGEGADNWTISDGGTDGGAATEVTFAMAAEGAGCAFDVCFDVTSSRADLTVQNFVNAINDYGELNVAATMVSGSTTKARVSLQNAGTGTIGNVLISSVTSSYGTGSYASGGMAGGTVASYAVKYSASFAPVTPSYFYGTSSVTLLFKAPYTGQPSLADIFSPANTEFIYKRSMDAANFASGALGPRFAMQISESFDLTDIIESPPSIGAALSQDRWLIQSKFDCPVLDFTNVTVTPSQPATTAVKPGADTRITSRGMGHQSGSLFGKSSRGVFTSITTPSTVSGSRAGIVPDGKLNSLASIVGWDSAVKQRIGQIKDSHQFEEAIIMVPFVVKKNRRKFFALDPHSGEYAKIKAVLEKYILPPKFDFVHNNTSPILFYSIQFGINLTKHDLANMWQGLPPKMGTKFEVGKDTVTDRALLEKMFDCVDELQWLVFKAKKRVPQDYTRLRKESLVEDLSSVVSNIDSKYSYNWPNDDFSLIELIRLDAEVSYVSQNLGAPGWIPSSPIPAPGGPPATSGMTVVEAPPLGQQMRFEEAPRMGLGSIVSKDGPIMGSTPPTTKLASGARTTTTKKAKSTTRKTKRKS